MSPNVHRQCLKRSLIDRVVLVRLDDEIAQRAIELPSGLRTMNALHLATMLYLGPLVVACLSFDDEVTAAALRHGIPAHSLGVRDAAGRRYARLACSA